MVRSLLRYKNTYRLILQIHTYRGLAVNIGPNLRLCVDSNMDYLQF